MCKLKRLAWVISIVIGQVVSVALVAPESFSILAPLRTLEGLGPIRITIEGFREELGASGMTDGTLRAAVVARMMDHRVPIANDESANVPTLDFTLLHVMHRDVYYVTIQAELHEQCSCSLPRRTEVSVNTLTTWSASQVGIVRVGHEARIEQLLRGIVDQFARAYQYDNPKNGESDKTSN